MSDDSGGGHGFPFLVFGGQAYYAMGGWNDFRGEFATLDSAKARVKELMFIPEGTHHSDYEWTHIVDRRFPAQIVWKSDGRPYGDEDD